jgi:ABC-type transport system substrate-binding protein
MAEIIQADLANVGVQVELQKLDQPDLLTRLQKAQVGVPGSSAWVS